MRGVRDIVAATLHGVPTSQALRDLPRDPARLPRLPRLPAVLLILVLVATNLASLALLLKENLRHT